MMKKKRKGKKRKKNKKRKRKKKKKGKKKKKKKREISELKKPARVFFALWPNDEERAALAAWQPPLQQLCGGRPTPAAKLHNTLVFLGDVGIERLEALQLAAQEVSGAAFQVVFDSARYWGITISCMPHRAACRKNWRNWSAIWNKGCGTTISNSIGVHTSRISPCCATRIGATARCRQCGRWYGRCGNLRWCNRSARGRDALWSAGKVPPAYALILKKQLSTDYLEEVLVPFGYTRLNKIKQRIIEKYLITIWVSYQL